MNIMQTQTNEKALQEAVRRSLHRLELETGKAVDAIAFELRIALARSEGTEKAA